MKLPALLVLLSALASLTVMEVVKDFRQICPQFFFPGNKDRKIIPTVLSGKIYKQICQFYEDDYRFATLYDTQKKIPVYSAYTFYKTNKKCRRSSWLNEPQLENLAYSKEMTLIRREEANSYTHQAVNKDYPTNYTRGHLFSCGYTSDNKQDVSTFTLTNIAPQTNTSNRAWADQVETPMLKVIQDHCSLSVKTPAYVVTGVVPGKRWIPIERGTKTYKEGVNIPRYYWTAFCCTNTKGKQVSSAYIAQQNNVQNHTDPITVKALNTQLSTLYDTQNYRVFGNECLTSPPETSLHSSEL